MILEEVIVELYGTKIQSADPQNDTFEKLNWENIPENERLSREELEAKRIELMNKKRDPTEFELAMDKLRQKRNNLLKETDKYVMPDFPHESEEKRILWLNYRKILRNLPLLCGTSLTENGEIEDVPWPVEPL